MSDLIQNLRTISGDANVITSDFAPYANDWRKKYFGKPLVVVKPANAEEVAAIVKLCIETKTPPEINGIEGYRSLDVILTAMEAAVQGKVLKVG